MTQAFQLQGDNFAVAANDDSQLYQLQLTNSQVPNAILVSVVDNTFSIVTAVHASFNEFDSDAQVPTSGNPGRGLVVIPGAPQLFALNTQAAATGNLFVSVASTANVTVYLTGVVI